jgi:hypothetical protein
VVPSPLNRFFLFSSFYSEKKNMSKRKRATPQSRNDYLDWMTDKSTRLELRQLYQRVMLGSAPTKWSRESIFQVLFGSIGLLSDAQLKDWYDGCMMARAKEAKARKSVRNQRATEKSHVEKRSLLFEQEIEYVMNTLFSDPESIVGVIHVMCEYDEKVGTKPVEAEEEEDDDEDDDDEEDEEKEKKQPTPIYRHRHHVCGVSKCTVVSGRWKEFDAREITRTHNLHVRALVPTIQTRHVPVNRFRFI